jgi:hypothetical protein
MNVDQFSQRVGHALPELGAQEIEHVAALDMADDHVGVDVLVFAAVGGAVHVRGEAPPNTGSRVAPRRSDT